MLALTLLTFDRCVGRVPGAASSRTAIAPTAHQAPCSARATSRRTNSVVAAADQCDLDGQGDPWLALSGSGTWCAYVPPI